MRRTTFALLALIASAHATSIATGLPSCAADCITTIPTSLCSATDIACQCSNLLVQALLTTCIESQCNAADTTASLSAMETTCENVGLSSSSTSSSRSTPTASPTHTTTPKKESLTGPIVGGVAAGVVLLVCIGLAIYTCGRRRARSDIDHEKGKAREEEHSAEEVHALQEQVHRLEEERDKVGRGEEQPPSYFASWKNL